MCRAFFFSSLFVLCCVALSTAGCEEAQPKTPELDLLQRIYARLKQDGGITDAKLSFIVYVKRVDGNKLLSVVFLRRAPNGKGLDLIGTATEAEVRVDLAENTLLVDARAVHWKTADGSICLIDNKIWSIDLPADSDIRKGVFAKVPRKEDLPLSAEDKEFLAERVGK